MKLFKPKYRLVKITENGITHFQVEERFLFFFWEVKEYKLVEEDAKALYEGLVNYKRTKEIIRQN